MACKRIQLQEYLLSEALGFKQPQCHFTDFKGIKSYPTVLRGSVFSYIYWSSQVVPLELNQYNEINISPSVWMQFYWYRAANWVEFISLKD